MSAKFPSRNVAEALERSLKNADLKAVNSAVVAAARVLAERIDYLTFSGFVDENGKLYYEFRTISDYTGEVKDSEKYYLNAGSKDLDAEDVYFLPAYGVKGKVTISYTAYASSTSTIIY